MIIRLEIREQFHGRVVAVVCLVGGAFLQQGQPGGEGDGVEVETAGVEGGEEGRPGEGVRVEEIVEGCGGGVWGVRFGDGDEVEDCAGEGVDGEPGAVLFFFDMARSSVSLESLFLFFSYPNFGFLSPPPPLLRVITEIAGGER